MKDEVLCPKCGVEMQLKHAKHGIHEGEPFYGCKRFPDCDGIRDMKSFDEKRIRVGSTVTLLFIGSGHKKRWTIFGVERESIARTGGLANTYQNYEQRVINAKNPMNEDRISDESPIGRAILDKHIGDIITYKAPDGEHTIKIIDVVQN